MNSFHLTERERATSDTTRSLALGRTTRSSLPPVELLLDFVADHGSLLAQHRALLARREWRRHLTYELLFRKISLLP